MQPPDIIPRETENNTYTETHTHSQTERQTNTQTETRYHPTRDIIYEGVVGHLPLGHLPIRHLPLFIMPKKKDWLGPDTIPREHYI